MSRSVYPTPSFLPSCSLFRDIPLFLPLLQFIHPSSLLLFHLPSLLPVHPFHSPPFFILSSSLHLTFFLLLLRLLLLHTSIQTPFLLIKSVLLLPRVWLSLQGARTDEVIHNVLTNISPFQDSWLGSLGLTYFLISCSGMSTLERGRFIKECTSECAPAPLGRRDQLVQNGGLLRVPFKLFIPLVSSSLHPVRSWGPSLSGK